MPPLIAPALALLAAVAASPAPACPPHLFVIGRSLNANVVVYDARLSASGELDPAAPVDVYWLMSAGRGQREALNTIERDRAYGFDVRPSKTPGTYRMVFRASFGRSLVVRLRDGCAEVTTRIDGERAILHRIFIQSRTTLFVPTVDFIEFFGHDLETGAPLYEKFRP